MTAPQDANDLLFGSGGAPSFQWADPETRQDYGPGTSVEGEILRTDARMQRDINDKSKMATWPDGKPKYVAIVTLQTDLRNPTVEDDDGQRSVWISGKYLTDAVKLAVRKTGAKQLEEGGYLKVTHTGYGKPEGGYRPPRLFEALYRRPTPEKLAEVAARKLQQQQGDPWANLDQSDPWGSGPVTQQPMQGGGSEAGVSMAGAVGPDPWGTRQSPQHEQGGLIVPGGGLVGQVPTVQPQPVQQSPVGGMDANVTPASAASVAGGGQMDLSSLTPEARALVEKMYAQQQGAAQ